MCGVDGEVNVPHRQWLQMFDTVVQGLHAELANQGRQEEFVGARVGAHILLATLTVDPIIISRTDV